MLSALLLAQLQGCAFDEHLNYYDLRGTVKIPIAATQFVQGTGDDARILDDIRACPLYLGVYPASKRDLSLSSPRDGSDSVLKEDGNASLRWEYSWSLRLGLLPATRL